MPHGRTNQGESATVAHGTACPTPFRTSGPKTQQRVRAIVAKHPKLDRGNHANHLGTLGTGNHFIEVCLDESDDVWFMLHSGSRGVGNRIGSYFIELARKDMRRCNINLPDNDLAYFPEGTEVLQRLC